MTDMIICLMFYGVSTVIFAFIHYAFLSIFIKRINIGHFLLAVATFWAFHIFNIIYTGMLGWNMEAANPLEQKLDNISTAGMLTSFVMLWRSLRLKKEEKCNG
jgi:hypothetical protein